MIIEMRLAKQDVAAVKAALRRQGIAVNAETIRAVIYAYGARLNEMSQKWQDAAKKAASAGGGKLQ